MHVRTSKNLRFTIYDLRNASTDRGQLVNRESEIVNSSLAFTLMEMLVVLAIIGILSAIALPYVKGMGQSNTMAAANRQMLDDVAYARQKAISDHTRVYMVFLPPQFWTLTNIFPATGTPSGSNADFLISGQCTTYALFSFRSIGDQPGKSFPRYLTEWRNLPEGALIETNKFYAVENIANLTDTNLPPFVVEPFATNIAFPFPPAELTNQTPTQVKVPLPYIAFDSEGKLVSGKDEYIPIVPGSILYPRDVNGKLQRQAPDIVEPGYREPTRTNYNLIHIDWLTGRAKIEKIELR